jgi:drug/metabolite transporter superfamily protein YnfA
MRSLLNQMVVNRVGVLVLLSLAAFLEAYGDSCFQSALYRASGMTRVVYFVSGALVLSLYGLLVNAARWEFGKLLAIYVVLFFVITQILAKVRFNQQPTLPILVGGSLIVAGGILMLFWKA